MRLPAAALALCLAASLGACSDPAAPDIRVDLARTALAESLPPTGRHLVLLRGPISSDFTREVRALGARVDWVEAGIATLSSVAPAASAALAQRKDVHLITEDIALRLDLPQPVPGRVRASENGTESAAAPAASLLYSFQWNLRAAGADLAWSAGYLGSPSVTTFILDTGIDYLYPDLQGRVDLERSVDLLGSFEVSGTIAGVETRLQFSEGDTVTKYFPTRAPYTDLFYHGTLVASTVSSNAVIFAGVTSGTRLVAVKVCSYLNACPLSSVLAGVIYAANHGADVINMSLGGALQKAGNGEVVAFINRVFTYARSRGVTIVVAAGNESLDLDHNGSGQATFCDAPGVICVSATGPTNQGGPAGPWVDIDASASYTNFGRSAIDLAAPGGNLNRPPARHTLVHAGCSRTSLVLPICQTGLFAVGSAGTSMAAPHVAGAAALLVPALGRSPAAIDARLQQSGDDLGQPGTDPQYGKGRLNIARALGVAP
jgi:subtilisin family serine protease